MIRFVKWLVALANAHRAASFVTAHVMTLPAFRYGGYVSAFSTIGLMHGLYLFGTLQPHSRLFGPVVRRVPNHDGVWVTIDDGPSSDTLRILELLRRYNAKATFFLMAVRAQQHPQLVCAICEAGHEIGNHTYTHPAAWSGRYRHVRLRARLNKLKRL